MASAGVRTTTPAFVCGALRRAVGIALCLIASAPARSAAGGEVAKDHTRSQTLFVLGQAIHQLAGPSADYRGILEKALAALPPDATREVPAGIRTFLDRAPAEGTGFLCHGDFVPQRARHALRRLREVVAGEEPARAEPAVCTASPVAVDVTGSPSATIDIYGFDFDAAPLQLVLVRSDRYVDVTPALVQISHYHLRLKLGEGGVPLPPTSQSVGLGWGHVVRLSIPLVQTTTPLCSSRLEVVPGRTISHRLHPGESSSLLGGGVVGVDATLEHEDNKLEATICLAARGRGDAAPGGCTVEFLYTTDPDRVIERIVGETTSTGPPAPGERRAGTGSHGLVREWILALGRERARDGAEAPVSARLNRMVVVSTERLGCISPITYLEAKRTGALGAPVTRALDRQLLHVDPAIRRLRPRFAP